MWRSISSLWVSCFSDDGATYQTMAKIAGINLGLNTLNNIYSTRNTYLQSIPLNTGKIVTGVLGAAIANCNACRQIETFEKVAFIGAPLALATGGTGGFALSGEVTVGSFLAKAGTDATIQTAANFTTNGGNLGDALGNVNLTQSALAGVGMNYIGNSLLSNAVNINRIDSKSIFTGGISAKKYATQAGLGIVGGSVANGISSSSAFKSTVIGTYMRTTSSFGQTAGTAVANVLMSTPDYGANVIQNKIP